MYAILIKLRGCRTVWTDTGIRTTAPDRPKRELRAQNPQCLVTDCAEADVDKMTAVPRG